MLEVMPDGPEPLGPMPPRFATSPIPLWPRIPNAPAMNRLFGSPIAAGSTSIVGESNATVIGCGNFGSETEFGGMNVRCAMGGGAPCRAGGDVLLLPPERSGLLTGARDRYGAISGTLSSRS